MFCFVSLYARTCLDLQEKMTKAFVANGAQRPNQSPAVEQCFNAGLANWLRETRVENPSAYGRKLWDLAIGLKSPHLSKEGVLLPRNDDLFVVREYEGYARTVKKTGLLDVHQVDDAIACRTEEGGMI
jgi:hypothetical protein